MLYIVLPVSVYDNTIGIYTIKSYISIEIQSSQQGLGKKIETVQRPIAAKCTQACYLLPLPLPLPHTPLKISYVPYAFLCFMCFLFLYARTCRAILCLLCCIFFSLFNFPRPGPVCQLINN